MCFCLHETTPHILTQCNYTEAAWNLVAPHLGLPSYGDMITLGGPVQWVKGLMTYASRKDKKKRVGPLLSFWWWI
jgi:hypothetical protein